MFVCCKRVIVEDNNNTNLNKNDFQFYSEKPIFQGSFGKVIPCIHKSTHKKFVAKILTKNVASLQEAKIYSSLSHKNIGNCIGFFTEKDKIYIISVKYRKDLYEIIMEHGGKIRDEQKVVYYVKQLLEGLNYIRSNNLIHRDIKLSNIMIDKTNTLKIIDFGSSKYIDELYNDTLIGTPGFFSPESILGIYSENCDMWSVGCVIFTMLFGFNPFNPNSKLKLEKILENTMKGFDPEVKDGFGAFFPKSIPISKEAMDFLANILVMDPKIRMTPDECLSHKWLTKDDLKQ